MLPVNLKPFGFNTWNREKWETYRERLGLPDDEAILQFYRQVVYDHFEHFNENYPSFRLEDYLITLKYYSAEQARDLIRYFNNDSIDFWGEQYDDFERRNYSYVIYQEMAKNLTPPFPPVLLEPSLLIDGDWRIYGRPLHLIEGTHRVSYLRRMLARRLITPTSMHKFVVLRPATARSRQSKN